MFKVIEGRDKNKLSSSDFGIIYLLVKKMNSIVWSKIMTNWWWYNHLVKVWVKVDLVRVVEVEDKMEDKKDTIHLHPCHWFVLCKAQMFEELSRVCILERKFEKRYIMGLFFSKSSYLIDLELSFKICASLNGGRSSAFYLKGQRL